jgi:hypothetical protein
MDLDSATLFRVLILAAIAGGFAWIGTKIHGDSPTGARKYLAWLFLGVGIFFLILMAAEEVALFGGPHLDLWPIGWLRSQF